MDFNFLKIIKSAEKFRAFFLDLIFPIECLGCARVGYWLCGDCFKEVKFKPKQYCLHCKKENDFGQFCPSPARLNDVSRSGGCRIIYSLNGVWIAALYDELLISQAIKSLKYHFISGIADDLSKLLILFVDKMLAQAKIIRPGLAQGLERRIFEQAKNMPTAILNFNNNLVIFVPLSKKRLRWRGFNQAELLAQKIAEKYNLALDAVNLIRVKHKRPQAKLDEIHRLENIKDCFEWRGGDLNKKNIILIDDVVTTGATLNECAKVLKAHGAGEVWGLVVAKG
ncbi:MAG: ComF family protein [Candidatus Falkowbacteria bacterium]